MPRPNSPARSLQLPNGAPPPASACMAPSVQVTAFAVLLLASADLAAASRSAPSTPPFSDPQLTAIREGFDQRAAAVFAAEQGRPLQRAEKRAPLSPGRAQFVRAYSFSLVEFAARSLWLNEFTPEANAALQEGADYYLAHPREIYDKDNFHWHSEALLRLVELFGSTGTRRAGALTAATEKKILEAVWLYCRRRESAARTHEHLAEADDAVSQTWYVKESENHHVQSFSTLWHFAQLARHRADFRDRRYDDGRTAADHWADWTRYAKLYFLERARKGMFIEMMSPAYNATLLKGIFNFFDFAEDPELRRRTGHFLDLYFAYWGQEQIDGVAGGGKARIYSDVAPRSLGLGYLFFGAGTPPALNCELLTALTTTWRPALVVVDLVCDRPGRGTYEVIQRPLGLAADATHYAPPDYHLRTDYGGIVRYSYCTPEFILGAVMCEARPETDWTMISSQNRRQGALFAGDPLAVISPQCEATRDHRAYNMQWSVQRRGTLITQKLKTAKGAGASRIWFSGAGLTTPSEERGWVFTASAGAYAALRVVRGGTRWVEVAGPVPGRWLYCDDEYSPVILEVAPRHRYTSAAAFRTAVADRRLDSAPGEPLRLRGLDGDTFTFFPDTSAPPRINDVPVDYAPAHAFASPFLESVWNSGLVHLRKGPRHLTLDFNPPP